METQPKYKTLRAYLKAMKKRGVKQGELAKHWGICEGYLSDLKSGRVSPSLELAVKIHDETGIPVESYLEKVS